MGNDASLRKKEKRREERRASMSEGISSGVDRMVVDGSRVRVE
jgi:hypothetical protein